MRPPEGFELEPAPPSASPAAAPAALAAAPPPGFDLEPPPPPAIAPVAAPPAVSSPPLSRAPAPPARPMLPRVSDEQFQQLAAQLASPAAAIDLDVMARQAAAAAPAPQPAGPAGMYNAKNLTPAAAAAMAAYRASLPPPDPTAAPPDPYMAAAGGDARAAMVLRDRDRSRQEIARRAAPGFVPGPIEAIEHGLARGAHFPQRLAEGATQAAGTVAGMLGKEDTAAALHASAAAQRGTLDERFRQLPVPEFAFSDPSTYPAAIAEQVPQLAATMGAGALVKGAGLAVGLGARAANVAGLGTAMAATGALEGSDAQAETIRLIEKQRAGQPLTPEDYAAALKVGGGVGAINALLDLVPAERFLGGDLAKRRFVTRFLQGAAAEGGTEYVQGMTGRLGPALGATGEITAADVKTAAVESLQDAFIGGALGGPLGAATGIGQPRQPESKDVNDILTSPSPAPPPPAGFVPDPPPGFVLEEPGIPRDDNVGFDAQGDTITPPADETAATEPLPAETPAPPSATPQPPPGFVLEDPAPAQPEGPDVPDVDTSPPPTPLRAAKKAPAPLPPLDPDVDRGLVESAWNVASARYPRIAQAVKRIAPLDTYNNPAANASFEPETGTLRVNLDKPLTAASLFHEFTHAAQALRGKAQDPGEFDTEQAFDDAIEAPARRRAEAAAQPQPEKGAPDGNQITPPAQAAPEVLTEPTPAATDATPSVAPAADVTESEPPNSANSAKPPNVDAPPSTPPAGLNATAPAPISPPPTDAALLSVPAAQTQGTLQQESANDLPQPDAAAEDAQAESPGQPDAVQERDGAGDVRGTPGDGGRGTVPGRDVGDPRGGDPQADQDAEGRPGDGRGQVDDAVREPGGRGSAQPGARAARGSGADYRAEPGALTRQGSWTDTARRNVEIIKLVKQLAKDGKRPTPQQQQLIAQYTGFGASEIAQGMFPVVQYGANRGDVDVAAIKPAFRPLYDALLEQLTPAEMATVKKSTQYAHYTSEEVIRGIWQAAQRLGFTGGRILEPGAGTGIFMAAAPPEIADASRYVGVEMDGLTAAIAKQLLGGQTVLHADYTQQNFPDNLFDAAFGNPPFASTTIEADPRYRKHAFSLHDYFFAKTIDKVRPGGILAFVTSRYSMDKQDEKARRYLADRADLVGAIRLPNTAFKANAGTEVVTDIVILKKRESGAAPGGQPWLNSKPIEVGAAGTVHVNEYFHANPQMVLGTHSDQGKMRGKQEYTVMPRPGQSLAEQLTAAVARLPQNIYTPKAAPKSIDQVAAESEVKDFEVTQHKEGGLYLSDNGTVMQKVNGVGVPIPRKLTPAENVFLKDYVPLRDAIKRALHDQRTDGDWEKSQQELVKRYRAFVKKHGRLQEHTRYERELENADGETETRVYRRYKWNKLLSSAIDAEMSVVLGLEKLSDESTAIADGDLLTKRVLKKPTPTKPTNVSEALAVSLNDIGRFDPAHIGALLDMTAEQTVAAMGDLVFEHPTHGWELADEYLAGDVLAKLEEAQAAAAVDERFQRNVDALLAVQPKPLGPDRVAVNLGANWIPDTDVTQFAAERLGASFTVAYDARTNVWDVDEGRSGRGAGQEWGTADRSPGELLSAILNNRELTIRRSTKGPPASSWVDKEATALVNDVADKMRQEFAGWIWTGAERASRLLGVYNRKFNNLVGRRFDGSHLTLPGLSLRFELHPHQRRAIWRIIQSGNTYLGHAVGAGKTLEMIVSAMEQKRLGLIHKPMFVVPNHMLEQFSNEFLGAYPAANILVADEQNFQGDERRRFVAKASLNDWDAIIIKQSSFKIIGVKQESADAVAADLLDELNAALDDTPDDNDNRVTRKKLEAQIEAINQKVARMTTGNKDKNLSFEEMGVDFLYVDEAHTYRKLDFATNRKVKGIDPSGSLAGFDLFVKSRYLHGRRPGRSMVLASGTPVTNTLAELYTIQRYMNYDGLKADNLHAFDAWATMFGEVKAEWERNAAGGYEKVERFAKFRAVMTLMRRVRDYMDVLTMRQLGDLVKRPDLRGGQPTMQVAKVSPALKAYMKGELLERLRISKEWKPSKNEPNNPDPVINIATDGRLAAIDMRFADPSMADDPGSKLNLMIDRIIETYRATRDNVYTDGAADNPKPDPIKGGAQIVFSKLGFGEMVAINRGFSPRKWMLKRLAAAGIPGSQVAFMGDYKTDAQKEQMFKEMRNGQKRILVGSPDNMGTGVNVQKRLVQLHYLAPPWYPADVEQPHGRILRQGNQNTEVGIDWYVTEETYDSTMWGMVRRKGAAIEQAFAGEDIDTVEDISEVSQYAMAEAIASGDDRVIQLAELQAAVEKLNRLRDAHFGEQQQVKRKIEWAKANRKTAQQRRQQAQRAVEVIGDQSTWQPEVLVGGTVLEKPGEIGQAVIDALRAAGEQVDGQEIGTVGGFPLLATFHKGQQAYLLRVQIGADSWLADSVERDFNANIVTIGQKVRSTLAGPEAAASEAEREIARQQKELDTYQPRLGAPFEREAELAEKQAAAAAMQQELLDSAKEAQTPPPQVEPGTPPADVDDDDAGDDGPAGFAGAKVTPPSAPRIPIAPLPGGTPKRLDQIVLDFEKLLGKEVRFAKPPRSFLGAYFHGTMKTVVRYAGDLDTTAHEIGHVLDSVHRLVTPWAGNRKRSPYDKELIPNFSGHGSVRPGGKRSKLSYQRTEGVAEWIRAYIVNPAAAKAAAPTFAAHFEATVPQRVRSAIEAFGRDVRRWEGQTASERQLSNVRVQLEEKNLLQRAREAFKGEGWSFETTWWDRLVSAAQDSLAPVMKGIAAAKARRADLGPMLPERDPELLIRLIAGGNDKYEQMLDTGLIDARGKKATPGGVAWLLEPLDASSQASLERDMRDTINVLVNERTLEKATLIQQHADELIERLRVAAGLKPGQVVLDPKLQKRIDRLRQGANARASRITGTGGGVHNDSQQAFISQMEINADPARRDKLQEAARRYRAWADANLRYMVDKGRMTQEVYDRIKESNQFYAAFHRVLDHHDPRRAVSRALASKGEPIQRFKGSSRLIENPYVNLLEQTYRVMHEADRNEPLDKFADLLRNDKGMHDGPPRELDAIGRRMMSGDRDTIPIYHQGKLEHWQFEKGVQASLKNWGQVNDGSVIATILSAPGKLTRGGVTHSPAFVVRNLIRDAVQRAVLSVTGSKPWDIFRGWTETEWQQVRTAGGGQFGNFMSDKATYHKELGRRMRELAGAENTVVSIPRRAWNAWAKLARSSELAGRMAEYRTAYAQARSKLGYDDYNATLYAAGQARGLLDYAIVGSYISKLNSIAYIPFLNAAIQGPARTLAGFRRSPKAFTARWAMYVLVPTLLEYAWHATLGEEDEEEYRQLPSWRRDFFWNFKIAHTWLSIPKPFELGVLSSGVARLIDAVRGAPHAGEGYAGSLVKALMPVDEGIVAGPYRGVIENLANYSFFFDRNVVPTWEKDQDLALRDTSRASRLGQLLQSAVGVDARMMDNLVRNQLGGLGNLAMDVSDLGRDDRQLDRFAGSAVGVATPPPAYNARDVQQVMREVRRLGLMQDPRVTRLRDALREQQRATTMQERDEKAKAVRDYATALRTYVDENADAILAQKKARQAVAAAAAPTAG